ncbi:hypothetical protein AgCh_030836 [Apium graveolens]
MPQRFLNFHSTSTQPPQENDVNYDHRFQRTGQWLPVYTWLESIKDAEEVVNTKDILDWLSANPDVRDDLQSRHSRGHLMHYIKQCHLKMLKRKEKKKGLPLTDKANTDIVSKGEERKLALPLPCMLLIILLICLYHQAMYIIQLSCQLCGFFYLLALRLFVSAYHTVTVSLTSVYQCSIQCITRR